MCWWALFRDGSRRAWHHQASAILTREAFRAAPIRSGFRNKLPKDCNLAAEELYIGNVCGFGATTCDAANYTLKLNTGVVDPALGASYIQFAMQGLRHQQSQERRLDGRSRDRFTYYKLVDSAVDSPKDKDKDKIRTGTSGVSLTASMRRCGVASRWVRKKRRRLG